MKKQLDPNCPCGSDKPYADCCAPLHNGAIAANAEALMRSRYTAYVFGIEPYLLATWHSSTRPSQLGLPEEPLPKWLGLKVMRYSDMGEGRAIVEFVARYQVGGRAHRLHEISRFVCEEGRWYYVDGEFSLPKT